MVNVTLYMFVVHEIQVFVENAGIMKVFVPLLCGYIDLNTSICGSTCIYAVIVATLV